MNLFGSKHSQVIKVHYNTQAMQNTTYTTKFARLANAEHTHDAQLYSDVGIKHWSMDQGNKITYQKDDSHTLSIYLKGGTKNYRSDQRGFNGAPGKICLMLQGQDSQWEIKGKVEFVHLYFSNKMLQYFAATHFGIDVRLLELRDLLFQEDQILQRLFNKNFLLYHENKAYSPLLAEQAIHELMRHLLKNYNTFSVKETPITGGLSPLHMRLLTEVIHDDLNEKLTIERLASLIDLSPYHFARMFKLSFGDSPANYITRMRVDTIKRLLQTDQSLAQISTLAGFNQQSHMTGHFKKITGMTPAVYRQKLS